MSDPFVYLMWRSDRRWKVGYSINPGRRVRQFSGVFFRIEQTWQTPLAWAVERIAHRVLKPHLDTSVPGRETYRTDKTVIVAVVEDALRQVIEMKPAELRLKTSLHRRPLMTPDQEAKAAVLVERYAQRFRELSE